MRDAWEQLQDLAASEPEGLAEILTDPETPSEVGLRWPDGSEVWLVWRNGRWNWPEGPAVAPCDVAARDAA